MARRNKYNAIKTQVDGLTFDSKKEARRFGELKMLQASGEIDCITVYPKYKLYVDGFLLCSYEADFSYWDKIGKHVVVEDVKSPATITELFKLKRKLMKILHNIEVRIV